MIGTNNVAHQETPQQTADGVRAIIEYIHAKSPKTKVLLLGIFPRGKEVNHKHKLQNDKVNAIISSYDQLYPFLTYLDIGKKFLNSDGSINNELMPDFLHPNARGYKVWAEAMEATVERLLK